MGLEEAMRILLSLPGYRSNVDFVNISVDTNRLKKGILDKNFREPIAEKNHLELYMDRS